MAVKSKARTQDINIDYTPMPKQVLLHESPATEILFGGAAGPGKSHAIRYELLRYCLMIPGLEAFLFRRTQPELFHNHVVKSLQEFPQGIGEYRSKENRWKFFNGSSLYFRHCQHEKDVHDYQGAEIHVLGIDELTTFTEFIYDFLRTRVRCTLSNIPDVYRKKIPCIITASNPGGVGHVWVKKRFVDFAKPMEIKRAGRMEGGMLRQFIPARLEDNEILMKLDPDYASRLDAMREPWRSALRKGDWNIFLGQAFNFSPNHHVLDKPMPVPPHAPLYMTMDWGFGAPFSVGWWWVDSDNRLFRFAEWYGWSGEGNSGLRMEDSLIAEGIKEQEKRQGIDGRNITRLAGPDCFNKKPDYKGGGSGPSTAEVFKRNGLDLVPGDATRVLKIRQFHERLRLYDDETMPMLMVYPSCKDFIRTIPMIQNHQHNLEDIDDGPTVEDHIYDEACHIAMYRPLSMNNALAKEQEEVLLKKEKRASLDSTSQAAWKDVDRLFAEAKEEEEENNEYWREAFGL